MVDSYNEKYSALTGSLQQSNEAFDRMKKEMAKVSIKGSTAIMLNGLDERKSDQSRDGLPEEEDPA